MTESAVLGLIRNHLKNFIPYASARSEFRRGSEIFLDANENSYVPFGEISARYPDPQQALLKQQLAKMHHVPAGSIFLGNGSDEAIDLVIRAFCEPNEDSILICPPTYGMYEVLAKLNNTGVKKVFTGPDFQWNAAEILQAAAENTKVIFLCSPNNPTGNFIENDIIKILLDSFRGIIVIDEAYIGFSGRESRTSFIDKYPNLIVLQTFSKAWGLAGLRAGIAFGNAEIIRVLNAIKYPYNINSLTIGALQKAISLPENYLRSVKEIQDEREWLAKELARLEIVKKVFHSEANFILARFEDSKQVFDYLKENGIIVRDRSADYGCSNCLRITVGNAGENRKLIETLKYIYL